MKGFYVPDKRVCLEIIQEKQLDGKILMVVYAYGVEKFRKVYQSWKSSNIARTYYINHFKMEEA